MQWKHAYFKHNCGRIEAKCFINFCQTIINTRKCLFFTLHWHIGVGFFIYWLSWNTYVCFIYWLGSKCDWEVRSCWHRLFLWWPMHPWSMFWIVIDFSYFTRAWQQPSVLEILKLYLEINTSYNDWQYNITYS